MTALEICVDSLESAVAAEAGGAQRVELCTALAEGGLTPSVGLIRAVRSSITIGVHVMIRPRAGDFLYSDDDFAIMKEDIGVAAQCGADGVALGLLTSDGDVDVARTRELVELARPMEVTFHRAFDMAHNIQGALEDVIQTSVDRVLTSGGEPTAMQGRHKIRELVRASEGRVRIMAGGGIRAENVQQVAQATGVFEFHAALRRAVPSPVKHQRRKIHLGDPGIDDYSRKVATATDVRALWEALNAGHRVRESSGDAAEVGRSSAQ